MTVAPGQVRTAAIAAAAVSIVLSFVLELSTRLDVLHVLVGVVGVVLARTASGAREFLTVGGVAYLGLWLLGAAGGGSWLQLDAGANWLHFLLGLGMLAVGYVAAATRERSAPG